MANCKVASADFSLSPGARRPAKASGSDRAGKYSECLYANSSGSDKTSCPRRALFKLLIGGIVVASGAEHKVQRGAKSNMSLNRFGPRRGVVVVRPGGMGKVMIGVQAAAVDRVKFQLLLANSSASP